MANVLSDDKKQQVLALGRLGWSLRRIEEATGVRHETASSYLKTAGIPIRPSGGWGRKPALPESVRSITEADAVSSTGVVLRPDPGRPEPAITHSSDHPVSKPAKEVTTDFGYPSGEPIFRG